MFENITITDIENHKLLSNKDLNNELIKIK